jgi:hypothetical protein
MMWATARVTMGRTTAHAEQGLEPQVDDWPRQFENPVSPTVLPW